MKKYLFLLILPILFLIPKDTFALEISSAELPGTSYDFGTSATEYSLYYDGSAWANWGSGYLYFDFSISTRNQTTSTSPFAFARSAIVWSSNVPYICEIGSTSVNNSTFVATTYSAKCPMTMGSKGLEAVNIKFGSLGTSTESLFNLTVTGVYTFEQANVTYIDNSGTISNDNANTNKITESQKETTAAVKEQTEAIKEQTEATKEQTEAITSEEAPDLDALEDSAGWLPPGPVDSILNLPLTFFNNLISNLSKTCQPVEIPLPYVSKNLILPCISTLYAQIGATTFLNWVGVIVGTIILYNYFLNLYKWIDDTIQMKDNSVDDWGGV